MPRRRALALIGMLLVAVAMLAVAAPVAAHPASPPEASPAPPAPGVAPPPAPAASTPGAPSAAPWMVVGALLVLSAAAAVRRRPRAALVVALALLLTVFAFENALHSVHHGFDPKQSDECTIAAAAAQLAAVEVDTLVESSVLPAVVGRATEPERSPAPIRLLGRVQGRAPPGSTSTA